MGGRAKDGTPVVGGGGGGGVRGHVVRGWSEEGWLGGFQREVLELFCLDSINSSLTHLLWEV